MILLDHYFNFYTAIYIVDANLNVLVGDLNDLDLKLVVAIETFTL